MSDEPLIGRRFAASLLGRALVEDKIPRVDDWENFVELLSKKATKVRHYNIYRKRLFEHGLDDHVVLSQHLVKLFPDAFSFLICNDDGVPYWNIFGCPQTRRDYDVILWVTDAEKTLYPGELEKFLSAFQTAYAGDDGFDPAKKLDICCISKKNGTYQTDTGGDETRGICYHSHDWHIQKHPAFFEESDVIPMETSDKLNTLSKFVMDKGEFMLERDVYQSIRKEKTASYNTGEDRYRFTFKLIEMSDMDPTADNWNMSFWKSFVMKLAQTYLVAKHSDYHLQSYPYDKLLLANKFAEDFPEWKAQIVDILTYKYTIHDPGFKQFLKELFIQLYEEHYPHLSDMNYRVPTHVNPTTLPDTVFKEFITSPKVMTDAFYEAWVEAFGDSLSIEDKFIEACTGLHIFDEFPTLKDRVLTMPQRSPEWQKAYREDYTTGRSGGIRQVPPGASHKERLALYYNLVMGCIGEAMIQSIARDYMKVIVGDCDMATVGMIVEGGLGSRAFCPDAVGRLESTGKLVVFEYKTIFTETAPCNNNVWLREYNLARLQMRGAGELINLGSDEPLTEYGVAFFMFIYPSDDGKYLFDVYWNQIDF
jgi:hypothetical protein